MQQEQKENQQKLQAANAELRERFLNFLRLLPGKSVQATMFEGNQPVEGIMSAVDAVNFKHFLVDQLRTPMGLIDHAALRTGDTVYIRIPWQLEEENARKEKNAEIELKRKEAGDKKMKYENDIQPKPNKGESYDQSRNTFETGSKKEMAAEQSEESNNMDASISKMVTIFDYVEEEYEEQMAVEKEQTMSEIAEKKEEPVPFTMPEMAKEKEEPMDEEKEESFPLMADKKENMSSANTTSWASTPTTTILPWHKRADSTTSSTNGSIQQRKCRTKIPMDNNNIRLVQFSSGDHFFSQFHRSSARKEEEEK